MRLKKSGGGELEVDKENVVALDGVVEQNFVALDQGVIQQNVFV
jgi:hypothetical protein